MKSFFVFHPVKFARQLFNGVNSFVGFFFTRKIFYLMGKKLPKSLRKFIRKEKARIRRSVLDLKEQEKLIAEVYQKLQHKSVEVVPKNKILKKKQPVASSPDGTRP